MVPMVSGSHGRLTWQIDASSGALIFSIGLQSYGDIYIKCKSAKVNQLFKFCFVTTTSPLPLFISVTSAPPFLVVLPFFFLTSNSVRYSEVVFIRTLLTRITSSLMNSILMVFNKNFLTERILLPYVCLTSQPKP